MRTTRGELPQPTVPVRAGSRGDPGRDPPVHAPAAAGAALSLARVPHRGEPERDPPLEAAPVAAAPDAHPRGGGDRAGDGAAGTARERERGRGGPGRRGGERGGAGGSERQHGRGGGGTRRG